jgi:hypothetical protein
MSASGDPAVFGAAATGIGATSLLLLLLKLLGFWEGGGEEIETLSSVQMKPLVEGILAMSNVRVGVLNAGDVAALVVRVVGVRVADTSDVAAVVSSLAVPESNSVLELRRVACFLGLRRWRYRAAS